MLEQDRIIRDIDSELRDLNSGEDINYDHLIDLFEFHLDSWFNQSKTVSSLLVEKHIENYVYDKVLLKNALKRYSLIHHLVLKYGVTCLEEYKNKPEREIIAENKTIRYTSFPRIFECQNLLLCSIANCSTFFYVEAISLLRTFMENALKVVYMCNCPFKIPRPFKPRMAGKICKDRGILGGLLDSKSINDKEHKHILELYDKFCEFLHRDMNDMRLVADIEGDDSLTTPFSGYREKAFKLWAGDFTEVVECIYPILRDALSSNGPNAKP